MRASWLATLIGGCGGATGSAPVAAPRDAGTPDTSGPVTDTAAPNVDSGWPDDGAAWSPGLTLVLDGELVADGATLRVDTAPAGLDHETTLRLTLTNRGTAAATLDPDPDAWLEGESWTVLEVPPGTLSPGESAGVVVGIAPGPESAAATRVATLQVPGGPGVTLQADIPRPLRVVLTGSGGASWVSDDYAATFRVTSAHDGTDHQARDLAHGGGRFFRADRAGGAWGDPGTYAWSEDGETWHESAFAEAFWASACTHGLDRFACARGDALTWSLSGQTVVHQATRWDGHLNDITWAHDRFVAVGRNGRRATSLDGETWASEGPLPLGDELNTVAAAAGVVVAAGGTNRLVLTTSADLGETWTDTVLCEDPYARFQGLAHDGTHWLASAFANGCDRLWTSTDGATWTPVDAPTDTPRIIGAVRGRFIGVDAPWQADQRLLYSDDGATWTEVFVAPADVSITAMAVETWEAP